MGIYINIQATASKGYEIALLKEIIALLEKGMTDFKVELEYGQGEAEVSTD